MSLSSLGFLHLTSPMAVLDRYQLISVIVSRPTVLTFFPGNLVGGKTFLQTNVLEIKGH